MRPVAAALCATLLAPVPQVLDEPSRVRAIAPGEAPLASAVAPRADAPPAASAGAARIDRLIASGDAADAFRAYALLERCRVDGACRGIGAVHLRQRLDLLERAARAGVPGAATAFAGQGPFGDRSALTQRPDDPLVAQWIRDAEALIREAARRDDVAAIAQLGWLAVHWDMAEAERFNALVASAHEWQAVALPGD